MSANLSNEELLDITEWDTVNWGKAIKWIDGLNLDINGKKVLEMGARNGGMSLYFANRGAFCTCTDLFIPGEKAKNKHRKWKVDNRISYAALDATEDKIPEKYINSFDIVTFKSVLGGVGSYENVDNEKKMVELIGRVLTDNGIVVFIENMKASDLHVMLRRIFRKHGHRWHYQTDLNINELFKDYILIDKKYYGYLGLFGPTEKTRKILGRIDIFFEAIIPDKWKYLGAYVYRKSN
ncbi:class I SAM-dependent methyltransferase [Butyrivibrio sp. CB08]|uniref:class I SAM-dependent methyltransferase n=1 Tax=Butyrivibrio sp. CB08 TaxID=2364879 RepID=UPI001313DEFE|nr:methyltransferase domain-containing protein [Butyrivibrio sp. CB08]